VLRVRVQGVLVPARRPGSVLSLVEPQERFVIQRLARRLGVAIPELQLAAGAFTAAGAGAADAAAAPAGAFTAAGAAAADAAAAAAGAAAAERGGWEGLQG
jgi:hypothetical protein